MSIKRTDRAAIRAWVAQRGTEHVMGVLGRLLATADLRDLGQLRSWIATLKEEAACGNHLKK